MLLIALLACSTVNETTYPERYAAAYCSFLKVCEAAAFNDEFSDRDDCVDEFSVTSTRTSSRIATSTSTRRRAASNR